jgi:ketosteroid isomerase-like protein
MEHFMNKIMLVSAAAACAAALFSAVAMLKGEAMEDQAAVIIAMERSALDRWSKGDPDGFLEISDPDVVYFDPFVERRLNSRDELKALYDSLRATMTPLDRYEMIDPKVEVAGDMAVLTFNFVSYSSVGAMRWNTTEVYRRKGNQWRIIHTHWSLTQPKLAGFAEAADVATGT